MLEAGLVKEDQFLVQNGNINIFIHWYDELLYII